MLFLRFVPFLVPMILGAIICFLVFGGIGSLIEGAVAGFIVGLLLMVARMVGLIGKKPAASSPP